MRAGATRAGSGDTRPWRYRVASVVWTQTVSAAAAPTDGSTKPLIYMPYFYPIILSEQDHIMCGLVRLTQMGVRDMFYLDKPWKG